MKGQGRKEKGRRGEEKGEESHLFPPSTLSNNDSIDTLDSIGQYIYNKGKYHFRVHRF